MILMMVAVIIVRWCNNSDCGGDVDIVVVVILIMVIVVAMVMVMMVVVIILRWCNDGDGGGGGDGGDANVDSVGSSDRGDNNSAGSDEDKDITIN